MNKRPVVHTSHVGRFLAEAVLAHRHDAVLLPRYSLHRRQASVPTNVLRQQRA